MATQMMATQIMMDRTGDTRHNFDAKNADALLKAEERFRELTGAGFTAAVRTSSGESGVEDPVYSKCEGTLFFSSPLGGYPPLLPDKPFLERRRPSRPFPT